MDARLKKLYEEIVETLREDSMGDETPDPQAFVQEEVARWELAKTSDDEIWVSIVLQMLRFGFNRFKYSHAMQPLIREKLGNLQVLAEMEEKDKKVMAADEDLGLNLQQIRSVAKNARTAVMLQGDFGSLTDLVDGSLDLEGIEKAIVDMAAASGRSVEEVDFLLEIFATGDERIGLSSICDVKSACFRCRVSREICGERRFEFGSAKEISRAEEF